MDKITTLQEQKKDEKYSQFKVSLPADFISFLGWEKGDELKLSLIVGSGKLTIEKYEGD